MLQTGHASLARVAQDGMRVRAAAGAASFRRRASLERCRAEAAAEVARLRAELEADPGSLSRRQAAARQRAAAEREQRVAAALAVAEELAAKQPEHRQGQDENPPRSKDGAAAKRMAKPAPEPRVSTTDAEARVMKMPDGGFRPAFNLGFASDPRSTMIAAVTLTNIGSDKGQLRPMSEWLAEPTGSGRASTWPTVALPSSPTSRPWPWQVSRSSRQCRSRAIQPATHTRHGTAMDQVSRPGASAWAVRRPRQSTRVGALPRRSHRRVRQRSVPQPRPVAFPRPRP